MFRRLIGIWVLVGTMLVPALTRAAAPQELKSVTVDLPALWRQLGVRSSDHGVTFDSQAPLAAIRASILG